MESKIIHFPQDMSTEGCQSCGKGTSRRSIKSQTFPYGQGKEQVNLTVNVPVWTCDECDFQYTDEIAERIRHNAVCAHLGVLNPDEIRSLRKSIGLTASAMSQLTGIGVASIKRWESAQLIQSKSSDNFLRLLVNPQNVDALKQRAPIMNAESAITPKFQTSFTEADNLRAKGFQLRKVG